MFGNVKTSIALFMLLSITMTMTYGSDKKPNHRDYAQLQKLAAPEQGRLSPRTTSAQNSPKSSTNIQLAVQTPDSPLPQSHEEKKSPILEEQAVRISKPRSCDPRRWDPRTQKCAAAVCSGVIIGTIATINQLRYYNRL